jgi:hypothetical protein
MAEDIKQTGIDLLTPVHNLLDLTPGGRDDWYAKLTYPEGPHWPLSRVSEGIGGRSSVDGIRLAA